MFASSFNNSNKFVEGQFYINSISILSIFSTINYYKFLFISLFISFTSKCSFNLSCNDLIVCPT
jgi:hypothetical protein